MVTVLASSTVDYGFEPRSGQIKDYKIVHAAQGLRTKDWLVWKWNNVLKLNLAYTETLN